MLRTVHQRDGRDDLRSALAHDLKIHSLAVDVRILIAGALDAAIDDDDRFIRRADGNAVSGHLILLQALDIEPVEARIGQRLTLGGMNGLGHGIRGGVCTLIPHDFQIGHVDLLDDERGHGVVQLLCCIVHGLLRGDAQLVDRLRLAQRGLELRPALAVVALHKRLGLVDGSPERCGVDLLHGGDRNARLRVGAVGEGDGDRQRVRAELVCIQGEVLAVLLAPVGNLNVKGILRLACKGDLIHLVGAGIGDNAKRGRITLIDRVLRQRLRAVLLGDRNLDVAPVDILERRACVAQRLGGGSELRFRAGNIVQRLLRIVQRGGECGKAFFLKILCIKGASVLNRLAQRGNSSLVHHRDGQLAALLLVAPDARNAHFHGAGLADLGGDGGAHRAVGNGVRLENALIRGLERDLERTGPSALCEPDEAVAVVGEALRLAQQGAIARGCVAAVELEGCLHCALLLQRFDRAQELVRALRHFLIRGVVVFINALGILKGSVKRLEGFLRVLAALHARRLVDSVPERALVRAEHQRADGLRQRLGLRVDLRLRCLAAGVNALGPCKLCAQRGPGIGGVLILLHPLGLFDHFLKRGLVHRDLTGHSDAQHHALAYGLARRDADLVNAGHRGCREDKIEREAAVLGACRLVQHHADVLLREADDHADRNAGEALTAARHLTGDAVFFVDIIVVLIRSGAQRILLLRGRLRGGRIAAGSSAGDAAGSGTGRGAVHLAAAARVQRTAAHERRLVGRDEFHRARSVDIGARGVASDLVNKAACGDLNGRRSIRRDEIDLAAAADGDLGVCRVGTQQDLAD